MSPATSFGLPTTTEESLTSSNRHGDFDELDYPLDDDLNDGLPTHSDVDARNLLDCFKSLTRDWNTNLRVTVDIVLDAAFSVEYDEPTSEELAAELESVLMQPFPPSTRASGRAARCGVCATK